MQWWIWIFSQIFSYLNKLRINKEKVNFDVLFEFINLANKKGNLSKYEYKEKFIFVEELKIKLCEFALSERVIPNDEKINNLFKAYPIDYNQLYEGLI